jgi:Lar family restriction alleviation protein
MAFLPIMGDIMNVELKPCPFCGSEANIQSRMDEDIWSHDTVKWVRVQCGGCDVETPEWPESVAEDEVYAVWNSRVGEK